MENNKNTIIGFAAMGALFVLFLIFTAIYYLSPGEDPGKLATDSEVDRVKQAALTGNIDSALALAGMKGPQAVAAMREVLQAMDDPEIKLAMVQGLGPNNKDFESVPLFLEIMKKNDKLEDLRQAANTAAELHVTGYFYLASEPLDDRIDKCNKMLLEYQKKKKAMESAPAGGGDGK